MALNAKELDRRFALIRDRYRENFTGHPPATRDLSMLDALIEENRALVAEAGEGAAAPLWEHLEFLSGERKTIQSAQMPDQTLTRATAWHELLRAHYRQRFAGQSRATRDLGLLREIVDHYGELISELEAAGADASVLEKLSGAKATYGREITEIEWARKAGSEAERGQRYALLANEQLALYRRHFAGQSRLTRSVALLRRVVRSLTEIRALMLQLPVTGTNAGNIQLVGEKLQAYEREIDMVLEAKRGQGVLAVADALGGAANKLFMEYKDDFAGQSRRTRSLDQLHQIIEALVHIARELEAAVAQPGSTQTHANNLGIVMDQVRMYTREADRIAEAQRGAGS